MNQKEIEAAQIMTDGFYRVLLGLRNHEGLTDDSILDAVSTVCASGFGAAIKDCICGKCEKPTHRKLLQLIIEKIAFTTGHVGEVVLSPRELTAENGAKAAFIGEFWETVRVPNPGRCDCGDEDHCDRDHRDSIEMKVQISWSNLKKIYSRVVSEYAPRTGVFESRSKVTDGSHN